jgi:cyclophilin family peptidyl-prolyl cis-trans isomerase
MVILHTSQGDITLELDTENAPATVANFLQYVRDGTTTTRSFIA